MQQECSSVENVKNRWIIFSFEVDMAFTLSGTDIQMTMTFQ